MIDLHTHVLPSVDDGSGSVEESLKLLEMLAAQGVKKVFATPHFLADRDTPASFFERRARAFENLSSAHPKACENLFLGAEVAYFQGVSRMSALSDMRLGKTKLLLLEMPLERWSDYTVKELSELACSGSIRPVLAHVERCMPYQPASVLRSLLDSGIIMQANASFFLRPATSRKALKLYKRGVIHAVASDCHNIHLRPPRIGEALAIIAEKLGEKTVRSMCDLLEEITAENASFVSN